MKYQIKNDKLQVEILSLGAQMCSIKGADGTEYLWQGNAKYWEDMAPNLFPYIARMTEKKYTVYGNSYEMDIHGFAKNTVFDVVQKAEDHILFSISDSDETRKQYPFAFVFEVDYRLEGSKLLITYGVKNNDDKVMYFGVGGHPGFNVPMEEGLEFEDYYLEFDTVEDAKRVGFSEDCFVTGNDVKYHLEDGKRIPLRHDMFDDDAIILVNMSRGVKLTSDKGKKAIHVTYPDMPYLGFWHWPKTDAPYICIEPWSSLPSRKGVIEDLETQPGLVKLEPNGLYQNQFMIEIK